MARKMYPNLTENQGPRIQFNWGFHDGVHDAVTSFNRTAGFIDEHYAAGYTAGQAEVKRTGTRPDCSQSAWVAYLSQMTNFTKQSVFSYQVRCNIGGLENCLRRRADDRMIDEATKRAAETFFMEA